MPKPIAGIEGVWNKKKWQDEKKKREHGPIPDGVCPEVKMGDALEKFQKDAKKNVMEGFNQANRVKTAITTYKQAIKDSYPAFHTRIENQLEYNVNSYIELCRLIFKDMQDYPTLLNTTSTEVGKAFRDFTTWKTAGSRGEFRAKNKKAVMDSLNALVKAVKNACYMTDEIDDAMGRKIGKAWTDMDGAPWVEGTFTVLMEILGSLPHRI
jgi:hypothetical protein